jgi:ABC-type phosphate/phosphonate transport system substrate-binding protein
LEKRLNRPVTVEFGESLAATMAKKTNGKADLIIGKESVVRHEASKLKYPVEPVVSLIGLDGKTTMTGLIVVAAKDPALTAADLKDHTLYFGFDDADEKFLMPMNLLKDLGVPLPKNPETCASCSVGATKVVDDAKAGKMAAAMISSYAQPLLEGCGTVQKGDLRVIGETDPVPFIVGFLSSGLTAEEKTAVTQGLVAMKDNADLCKVLESKGGFVLWQAKKK